MTPNKLALVVSYYLARYNMEGVNNLGFSSFREAFDESSKLLGVNKNYIKLRRDEFDKIFPWRAGWQAPFSKQVVRTIQAFQDLEEPDLREMVLKILHDETYRNSEDVAEINLLLDDDASSNKKDSTFILRAPTGKKAEDFFIDYHRKHEKPLPGNLRDTRDLGCGYDFEISDSHSTWCVEVKGLSTVSGGILFTNKEWRTALSLGNLYFLAIVRNVDSSPEISFIQNPALILKAKKNIFTSIQIQWSISEKDLSII
jgi:hypothetical protein